MAKDEAYYKAEKKIEEALLSGETKLDLSEDYDDDKKKITEFPTSIGKPTKLRTLILPDTISQLNQLQYLS